MYIICISFCIMCNECGYGGTNTACPEDMHSTHHAGVLQLLTNMLLILDQLKRCDILISENLSADCFVFEHVNKTCSFYVSIVGLL